MNEYDETKPGLDRSSAFDPLVLTELEDLFGRSQLMELLGALDLEIARRLDPPAGEPSQLARDAHILVSSSGALAFQGLSGACVALEQACLSGADVKAALGQTLSAAQDARAAIALLRAA